MPFFKKIFAVLSLIVILTMGGESYAVAATSDGPEAAEPSTILDKGHIDIAAATDTDGGLRVTVHTDTQGDLDPQHTIISVGAKLRRDWSEAAEAQGLDFFPPAGTVATLLPQNQEQDLPWPGFSSEYVDKSRYPADLDFEYRPHSRTQWYSFLTGSAGDGVGMVAAHTGIFTRHGIGHMHVNWVFVEAGTHIVDIRVVDPCTGKTSEWTPITFEVEPLSGEPTADDVSGVDSTAQTDNNDTGNHSVEKRTEMTLPTKCGEVSESSDDSPSAHPETHPTSSSAENNMGPTPGGTAEATKVRLEQGHMDLHFDRGQTPFIRVDEQKDYPSGAFVVDVPGLVIPLSQKQGVPWLGFHYDSSGYLGIGEFSGPGRMEVSLPAALGSDELVLDSGDNTLRKRLDLGGDVQGHTHFQFKFSEPGEYKAVFTFTSDEGWNQSIDVSFAVGTGGEGAIVTPASMAMGNRPVEVPKAQQSAVKHQAISPQKNNPSSKQEGAASRSGDAQGESLASSGKGDSSSRVGSKASSQQGGGGAQSIHYAPSGKSATNARGSRESMKPANEALKQSHHSPTSRASKQPSQVTAGQAVDNKLAGVPTLWAQGFLSGIGMLAFVCGGALITMGLRARKNVS